MKKYLEQNNPNSCFNKADDEEPVFVLRAQDKLAPIVIRLWADLAHEHGCSHAKTFEARSLANDMEIWFNRKFPD